MSSSSSITQDCENCDCFYGLSVLYSGQETFSADSRTLNFEADFSEYTNFSSLSYHSLSSQSYRRWEYFNSLGDNNFYRLGTPGLTVDKQDSSNGMVINTFDQPVSDRIYYVRRRSYDGVVWSNYLFSQQIWGDNNGAKKIPVDISGESTVSATPGANVHFQMSVSQRPDFTSANHFDTQVSRTGWLYSNGTSLAPFPSGGLLPAYQDNVYGYVCCAVSANPGRIYFVRYKGLATGVGATGYEGRVIKAALLGDPWIPINLTGAALSNAQFVRLELSLCSDFNPSDTTVYQTHLSQSYPWYYLDRASGVFAPLFGGLSGVPLGKRDANGCIVMLWDGAVPQSAYYARWCSGELVSGSPVYDTANYHPIKVTN
jgi:hypothetical protein